MTCANCDNCFIANEKGYTLQCSEAQKNYQRENIEHLCKDFQPIITVIKYANTKWEWDATTRDYKEE